MRARILTLDQTAGQPVGGKALGLSRLRDMGLRVPEALVLVGAQSGDDDAMLEAIESRLGDGALAVRSSAIGEDGAEASFAGQYETVLDVRGRDAIARAIDQCLASSSNDRSAAYRSERDAAAPAPGEDATPVMSIVVQRLVDARASGVCFTADPVTNRRARLVLDAIAGLGEALVSGHASPDHYQRRSDGSWEAPQLAGEAPVLGEGEREQIAREAVEAAVHAGEPLDLEWAIDHEGTLYWLQARPITTLGPDPQALDTNGFDPSDVFTRCNVGEMMPGAVSPLTFSTCARGIDVGWQDNMIGLGVRERREAHNVYIGMTHGHLFIDLSEGARFASAVTGSHPDQQSLAICGRIVPEVVAPPAPPRHVRLPRTLRQIYAVVRAAPQLRALEKLVRDGAIEPGADAQATWRAIDAKRELLFEAYARHLTVSSGAGALAPILLRILAGDDEPSEGHHAAVAQLLSGASNVESADIAEGSERVLRALQGIADAGERFADAKLEEARAWLESPASGEAGREYARYIARHGHRSLRELDVRQPEWAHDPSPLLEALRTQLRGRRARGKASDGSETTRAVLPLLPDARRLRFLIPIAHRFVRNRERSKSLLVASTVHFKRGYRALAAQLVAEGRLPDEDAVYFLEHEELGELCHAAPGSPLMAAAVGRREALAFQETLGFPEVSVGLPHPEALDEIESDDTRVVGKPVSRGLVEGRVRVVHDLVGAESLEVGEILVAPITDVGWTPYFAIIAGLVTDVGSAVSHGAVVAREYGLPAVLNTRNGTRLLRTGDHVRLDGDRGTIEILERASERP